MSKYDVRVFRDLNEVSLQAAELFAGLAAEFIQKQNRFSVALSGGSTPKALFDVLASPSFRERIPWSDINLFWGDERCVSPDHKDSNYRMALETLLEKVSIPEKNIFRIHAENPDPADAAMQYENTLRNFFGSEEKIPRFDLIFLGMGDDGHTASLFPFTNALQESRRWVVENYVEKFQAYRITLTVPVINNAANVVFMISGGSKAQVLKEVLEGPPDPNRLPSQLIQPVTGNLLFMVDKEASKELHSLEG
jgi:6-phosphogluconolactonase